MIQLVSEFVKKVNLETREISAQNNSGMDTVFLDSFAFHL